MAIFNSYVTNYQRVPTLAGLLAAVLRMEAWLLKFFHFRCAILLSNGWFHQFPLKNCHNWGVKSTIFGKCPHARGPHFSQFIETPMCPHWISYFDGLIMLNPSKSLCLPVKIPCFDAEIPSSMKSKGVFSQVTGFPVKSTWFFLLFCPILPRHELRCGWLRGRPGAP